MNQPQGRLRRTMVAAVEDGNFMGYSLVYHRPAAEDGRYYIDVAVNPNHRQKGLGAALYEDAIRFAKNHGADSIRAHNDSQNAPMLAINRKLGYKPQVGEYRLTNHL